MRQGRLPLGVLRRAAPGPARCRHAETRLAGRGLAPLLLLLLGACAAAAGPARQPTRRDSAPAVGTPPGATAERGARGAGAPVPVTHLGRTILAGCDLIIRGRVESVTSVVAGTEVARVDVRETLLAGGTDDARPPARVTVFCGQEGLLPRAGGEAVLLLRQGHGASSYETLQVAPLEGSTGEQRVEALTRYVEIELLPTEQERVEGLLEYLREAALDPHPWTRDNAALEYGSLARARPDDIGPLDAQVLQIARTQARTASVRRALDAALAAAARAPRASAEREPETAAVGQGTGRAEAWIAKMSAAPDAAARRAVLLDGALELRDASLPLLRRGVRDDDPRVREAAVAAAGELRVVGLDEELLMLLSGDEPAPVRRSTIRALGYLRSEPAVPALSVIAEGRGTLGSDACYALARIRSPEALASLRTRLAAGTDGERRELLEFLLSPAFVDQERGLGREVPAD